MIRSDRDRAAILRGVAAQIHHEANALYAKADEADRLSENRLAAYSDTFNTEGSWSVVVGNVGTAVRTNQAQARRAWRAYLEEPPDRAEDTVCLFDADGELKAEGDISEVRNSEMLQQLADRLCAWHRDVAAQLDAARASETIDD